MKLSIFKRIILTNMIIEDIILCIVIAWVVSISFCLILIIFDNDIEIDNLTIFLFPPNLIFIIKYWWKAIIKAVKS